MTLNNGDSYDAKLVGGEELNDVAVLKIDGVSGLKPVVLGDSDDLVVGETVCTIGNALGTLSFSQTSGHVSSTGRSITMSDGTVMNNMIQTDCTINSGNSGGPLFDSYGRVVGITSAKLSNNGQSSQAAIEGIGFAIPINDVVGIVTDFMEYGYVTGRPYMGITVQDVTQSDMQRFGWPQGGRGHQRGGGLLRAEGRAEAWRCVLHHRRRYCHRDEEFRSEQASARSGRDESGCDRKASACGRFNPRVRHNARED